MKKENSQLISSILEADIVKFRALTKDMSDDQMVATLEEVWSEHRASLEKNEESFSLFLEIFNYQYNKYLINRPRLGNAGQSQIRATKAPIKPSLIKDVFGLIRERKVLAY